VTAPGLCIREATVPELPDVLNVLDGGVLQTDAGRIRAALDSGDVLVAVTGTAGPGDAGDAGDTGGGRVLGALVLDGEEITAVAVRPRRRDQGIGTALVGAAADSHSRLVAEFDAGVCPFWEAAGFDIEPADRPDRYRGLRS
jgi:GNAT superfamily N-acetyltransferase